jgi:hypothetical protein
VALDNADAVSIVSSGELNGTIAQPSAGIFAIAFARAFA